MAKKYENKNQTINADDNLMILVRLSNYTIQ